MEPIVSSVIHYVLIALATALTGLVMNALLVLTARLNIKLKADQDDRLRGLVRNAIAKAEEYVEAQVKKAAMPIVDKGSKKMDQAIQSILEKTIGLTHQDAQNLVLEELGKSPFGASGKAPLPFVKAA